MEYIVHSKRQAKTKFALGISALLLANVAVFIWPPSLDLSVKIFCSIAESAIIIHIAKIPRYWRAFNSFDLEIISSKSPSQNLSNFTTLPFKVSGIIVIGILILYLLSSVIGLEIHKILLGMSLIPMFILGFQKVIMFNYQNKCFYGLWETKSFYDSDRQSMVGIQLEYHEDEVGVAKVKIEDKSGYYFISRKNFPTHNWERILINFEKIALLQKG